MTREKTSDKKGVVDLETGLTPPTHHQQAKDSDGHMDTIISEEMPAVPNPTLTPIIMEEVDVRTLTKRNGSPLSSTPSRKIGMFGASSSSHA